MKIQFTKMHGLGNDFVVIDAINQQITLSPEQIRFIADRHFGIGCDQLLLVESPTGNADFRYRIFNADGGEVAQCGNGARCFARFIHENELSSKSQIRVETLAGQLLLTLLDNGDVRVNMGIPEFLPEQIPLEMGNVSQSYTILLDDDEINFGAVSMGNPHAVLRVDDIASAPVEALGARLEKHPVFPERANIGFMQILDRQHIALRVYERGAAETLACGSGACAAAIIGIMLNLLEHNVSVRLPGGKLDISWSGPGEPVFMSGPATSVFRGTLNL